MSSGKRRDSTLQMTRKKLRVDVPVVEAGSAVTSDNPIKTIPHFLPDCIVPVASRDPSVYHDISETCELCGFIRVLVYTKIPPAVVADVCAHRRFFLSVYVCLSCTRTSP